jgi:hypothetical protein
MPPPYGLTKFRAANAWPELARRLTQIGSVNEQKLEKEKQLQS